MGHADRHRERPKEIIITVLYQFVSVQTHFLAFDYEDAGL